MTPEARSLKLSGIATLFIGLIVIIAGIVYAVMSFDVTDVAQIISGTGGLALGAKGARSANVPSTAAKVIVPAVIVALVSVAAAVYAYLNGGASALIQFGCICAVVVAAVAVAIAARNIKRALDRK